MIITIWCITIVVISIFAVGIPLFWIVNNRRPLSDQDWIGAPFLGIAAIILVLQNLVYLDIPIERSTSFLWIGVLLLWIWFVRSDQVRASLAAANYWLFAVALAVYLIQGLGLILISAQLYVGRAWLDQFNYNSIAQVLVHEPFSTPMSALGHRPYLVPGLALKAARIGQSVLHGFFAVSSLSDTKALFEPTILLSAGLTVLAIYALCRRFSLTPGYALAVSAVSGLIPAVTQVHLESFLSQALMLPFLIIFLVVLDDLNARPGLKTLLVAALLFATATTIYTEFWIILTGLVVLNFVVVIVHHPSAKRLICCYAILLLAPFALIPPFAGAILATVNAISGPILQSIFPWAFQIQGLSRLWLGDLVAVSSGVLSSMVRPYGIVVTALAYYGLASMFSTQLVWVRQDWLAPERRRGLALAAGTLVLAFLPIMIFALNDQNPYQFYKVMLSISPLLMMGVALPWRLPQPVMPSGMSSRWAKWLDLAPAVLVISVVGALGLVGTAGMATQSASSQPAERHNGYLLLQSDLPKLQEILEQMRGDNILIIEMNPYRNGWLTYFARHNQVWLGNPGITSMDLTTVPEASGILDLNNLPDDIFILTKTKGVLSGIPESASIVWSGEAYQLWKPSSRDWATVVHIENQNGIEMGDQKQSFWMGTGDTKIKVLSGKAGMLRLTATFRPGPSVTTSPSRTLLIVGDGGYRSQVVVGNENKTIELPVQAGLTEIVLRATDKPTITQLPNGDPRPLVLGVEGLTVHLASK